MQDWRTQGSRGEPITLVLISNCLLNSCISPCILVKLPNFIRNLFISLFSGQWLIQKLTICQSDEKNVSGMLSYKLGICITHTPQVSGAILEKGEERSQEPEFGEDYCEIVTSGYDRTRTITTALKLERESQETLSSSSDIVQSWDHACSYWLPDLLLGIKFCYAVVHCGFY